MRCPSCQFENREGARFCRGCPAFGPLRGPAWGAEPPPQSNFCDECASPLTTQTKGLAPRPAPRPASRQSPASYTPSHLAERIQAEREALEARAGTEGERKTITALFADIKGSMELMEDLDPEEAGRIIDPALRLMMAGVHRYEGYVVQS